MFKNKFQILYILIILILISSTGFAEDDLTISSWIIDSTLLDNGDLKISEDITFDFNNEFNGVFRNIVLDGTNGISQIELYEIVDSKEVPYSLNMNAQKGDTNVFKSEITANAGEIMIFSPSKNEKKTFRIKYILNNVATKHKDTGELYYKFLGKENNTPIGNFSAIINLPSMDRDKTKIFTHGPSNGHISFIDDSRIKLEVSNVPSNTFIEARILFPNDFIQGSTNEGNKNLKDILDEELSFIKGIEEKAASKSKMKNLFNNISLIITGLGAIIISLIFTKFRRDTNIYDNMYSLSPESITPAELRLFYYNVSDSRSIIATIFDLARKDYISIDDNEELKEKKTEFIIIIKEKSKSDLLPHEVYLLDWIFNTIGNGNKVSTVDIDIYRKTSQGKFIKEFGLWQSKIKSDLKNRAYYDDSTKSTGIILLFLSFASFIISIIALVNSSLYGFASMILAFVTFIYGLQLMFRRSDLGYIQYKMWKDYKNDLERQGKTPANYNESVLKDEDLIYALALGLPMKSLNTFRDKIPQTYMVNHWMYWYFISNSHGGSRFEDSFNSSFYGNTSTTTSTSFGGGGGFSGGGGGGAGGGGAGGF